MSTSENRILGYGLGTVALTVWRVAEDAREVVDDKPMVVNLHVDQGKLNPSSLTIPSGQSRASTELRSSGIGKIKISADSGSWVGELEGVRFVFPIAYTLAGVIGGCLGGAGRIYRHYRRTQKRRFRYLLEGCVVGIVTVGAAAAGMVLFTLPTSVIGTELGAFMLSALGGYTGAPLFQRLSKLTTKAQTTASARQMPA
jgi:hypothetical protein